MLVLNGSVDKIHDKNVVLHDGTPVPFDYLVIASGSSYDGPVPFKFTPSLFGRTGHTFSNNSLAIFFDIIVSAWKIKFSISNSFFFWITKFARSKKGKKMNFEDVSSWKAMVQSTNRILKRHFPFKFFADANLGHFLFRRVRNC